MTAAELAAAISSVRAHEIDLIRLFCEAVNETGETDITQLPLDHEEVQAAVRQAKQYINATKDLMGHIRWTLEHPLG